MPDVPLDTSITGSGTVTSGFTPNRAMVAAIAAAATITSGFTPNRAMASTVSGNAAVTSGFTPNRSLGIPIAGHGTIVVALEEVSEAHASILANSTFTASSITNHFVTAHISAFSAFGTFPPDVTHHFPPPHIPPSNIPVVRAVPNPPPFHHVTIQPPRATVLRGPTSAVNVKKTK